MQEQEEEQGQEQSDGNLATEEILWSKSLCVEVTLVEDEPEDVTDHTSAILAAERSNNSARTLSGPAHAMTHKCSSQVTTPDVLDLKWKNEEEVTHNNEPEQGTLPRQGTVRFGTVAKKSSSICTTKEDASSPRRRSEGSLFQRLLSRTRSRTMTPRTKSRLATLLVLPDKGSSRRARVTLEALPQSGVAEKRASGFMKKSSEASEKVTRADSVKSERRGRTLFRGIGAHFSTSARRSRARSPVRDREGILSRVRWRRTVSPSPDPGPRQRHGNRRKVN